MYSVIRNIKFSKLWYSIIFFCINSQIVGQNIRYDSVFVTSKQVVILKDSVIIPYADTLILIPSGTKYKIKYNPDYKTRHFYDSLAVKAHKGKISKGLFQLIVRSDAYKSPGGQNFIKAEEEFIAYKGLIIRNINIWKADILSGSVNDTSASKSNNFSRNLNKLHIHTSNRIIRNNLLFKKGESISPYRLADNERILRNLRSVEDANILVSKVSEDSADITVIVKDVFPIGVDLDYSSIQIFKISLAHRNLLGLGQEFRYTALIDSRYDPFIGNKFELKIDNISGSFISGYLLWAKSPLRNQFMVRFDKQFLTPETKYGGGLAYENIEDSVFLVYPDTSATYKFKRNHEAFWLGRSWRFKKNERVNFIATAKYERNYYDLRPVVSPDTNQYFQNVFGFLGSMGIRKINSVKTRYLLSNGITEDAQVGYLFNFIAGYFWSELDDAIYLGLQTGVGYGTKSGGYFGSVMDIGSFFYKKVPFGGVFNFRTRYYPRLFKVNRAYLRFIAEFEFKKGINSYPYDYLSLNDDVRGLSNDNPRGTTKSALWVEAILFHYMNFYGFKFASYVFSENGAIGYNANIFSEKYLCSGVGLGFRIKNESLVFPLIEFSFVYYPRNPVADKSYKFIFSSSDRKLFRQLQVGEPGIIEL